MRVRLYAELKRAAGPGAAPAAKAPPSLQRHVLDCLVAEFLLAAQHKYSLSVFLAETGSGALPQLARADILRLIGVLPESRVHALLTAGSPDSGGSSATAAPCLAESMVAALGTLGGRVSTHTTAAQTDSDGSGDGSGAPSSCQLAQRLQQVEEEYRRRSGQLEAASAEALETRMAAYRRECEARCEAQLQERLAAARGAEAAAAAEQEAGRHRRELEAERDALQAAHRERLAQLQAAEEALHERSRRHQREQDALREEHLRRLRADEERLAAWKADSEAKLAAREAAARQQLAQAEAAAQQASAQQAAAKQRLAAMLAEVQAREAAAGRAQAAADAQGSRVPQLQAQLAAALEEQGSLRQQLAAARAAQQAEAAERQRQVEALQAEQARLAAAAEGPRLSPAEAQRMQHAVRRLLQRTDDLQAEAEACRGREALWKGAATKAERLLGKVGWCCVGRP